jgi:Tfp pilus assembly protein PilN
MSVQTAATTATTISSRVDWAPVPKVNLLPPEIVEKRQFARRQKALAVVVVATIAAAGAATYLVEGQVASAQDELTAEQARTSTLQAEKSKYDEVPRVLAQVDAAKAARETAMGTDVPWYRFMNDVALSTPRSVWLTNLTVTVPPSGAAAPSTVDPLAPAGVGTLTVTGDASDFPTVAAWLEGLDQVAGVDGTAISQAAGGKDKPTVAFTSSGSITPDALSHRYDRKAD